MPDTPESSRIASYDYDKDTSTLKITFRRGGYEYHYYGMDSDTASRFARAKSKGSFLSAVIQPRFAFQRISAGKQ